MGRRAVSATPPRPGLRSAHLAITGVGLATSVGSSALASFTALQAGIARFAESPGVMLGGSPEPHPAVVARSPLTARAAGGPERAIRLLEAVVADPLGEVGPARWSLTVGGGLGNGAEPVRDALPGTLAREAVVASSPEARLRHCGPLDALALLAERGLRQGEVVALAAVDSLVTDSALSGFAALGRLKGAANPGGFIPGEAAGVVVVEREDDARAAGRAVLAVVEAWGRGEEPVTLGSPEPSRAAGLTDALADAVAGLPGGVAVDLAVLDLNGERARALEWALAAPRALPFQHARRPVWTPTDGVGDCGEASGTVLLVCAALAVARGPATRVLVATSDDDGARRAVVVRAPAPPGL